jgi:hypothetical protein
VVGRCDGDRSGQGLAQGHPAHVDHPGAAAAMLILAGASLAAVIW